ncbi:MAG TPA: DNA translocase FtsK 4TM domain-containing protein [Acidimicrobiales bacterium]|nr:DNA translocase FtsK 4TM domain-containing protein [Acidimicrobiales bacterium]
MLEGHVEDAWGIGLVTVGILGALGLYGDALGPVGHGLRHALGMVLGVGRFLVPPAFATAGVMLIAGRPRHEPARAGFGLALTLASVAGLADLAGGAPRLSASSTRLSGAGGFIGAAFGNPLRSGLGDWGASVVLLALVTLALVLFTGVTLRAALAGVARVGRELWRAGVPHGDAGDAIDNEGMEEDDTEFDLGPETEVEATGHLRSRRRARPVLFDLDEAVPLVPPPAPAEVVATEPDPDRGPDNLPDPRLESQAVSAVPSAAGDGLAMDSRAATGDWRLPPMKMLSRSKPQELDRAAISDAGRALVRALAAHGVETRLLGHTVGPTVTRFELELGPGVKVARVTSLAKDIAYAMASADVRILAPIPGKSAIGIEVPNRLRQLVTLGDVLASDEARKATHPLEVALGRDIAGRPVIENLADMPHILISGATGAGKSSCINSLITSIMMRATPEELRLILVDPKRVELGQYNGLPHLLTQVVVDPKKAANALSWAVTEMERRYDVLAEAGMRDITGYNAAVERGELDDLGPPDTDGVDVDEDLESGDTALDDEAADRVAARLAESREAVTPTVHRERLPFILIVVDELNDLMMVAARDVEESVCRIAQMARAVGIHLVLATQRPSVDVITGVIKANVPSRLAFSVSSLADSRVILDQPGAERLIGKGDMLLLTASSSVARRIQGPWVAESEVRTVVAHWQRQRSAEYVVGIAGDENSSRGGESLDDDDELLSAAMELVVRSQLGSTSMLQRKLRVGFSRAGRLMDLLERRGVVGPSEGSKARAVLMAPEELEQLADR